MVLYIPYQGWGKYIPFHEIAVGACRIALLAPGILIDDGRSYEKDESRTRHLIEAATLYVVLSIVAVDTQIHFVMTRRPPGPW